MFWNISVMGVMIADISKDRIFTPKVKASRPFDTSASIITIIKRNTPEVLTVLTFSTKFK
jgi:hypothetical protein